MRINNISRKTLPHLFAKADCLCEYCDDSGILTDVDGRKSPCFGCLNGAFEAIRAKNKFNNLEPQSDDAVLVSNLILDDLKQVPVNINNEIQQPFMTYEVGTHVSLITGWLNCFFKIKQTT